VGGSPRKLRYLPAAAGFISTSGCASSTTWRSTPYVTRFRSRTEVPALPTTLTWALFRRGVPPNGGGIHASISSSWRGMPTPIPPAVRTITNGDQCPVPAGAPAYLTSFKSIAVFAKTVSKRAFRSLCVRYLYALASLRAGRTCNRRPPDFPGTRYRLEPTTAVVCSTLAQVPPLGLPRQGLLEARPRGNRCLGTAISTCWIPSS